MQDNEKLAFNEGYGAGIIEGRDRVKEERSISKLKFLSLLAEEGIMYLAA